MLSKSALKGVSSAEHISLSITGCVKLNLLLEAARRLDSRNQFEREISTTEYLAFTVYIHFFQA